MNLDELQSQSGASDLLIGSGVHFKGTIKVPNRALINGHFEGELDARELIVETNGKVTGTTTSQNLIVRGALDATSVCHELLSIGMTGSVKGQVEYGELTIERGGQFQGSMKQRN